MNRNAIIMAAGMSSRFTPISMETPKALLNVRGEILIERQIRQLQEADIREIVVVVGYLKEKFRYLEEKYNVILLENPYYNVMNNISTLYVAKGFLGNTYICSSDNYFTENVFIKKSEESYYAAVYESGNTDEWCLALDSEDRIIGVTIGGANKWIMKGHAYFSKEYSKRIIPLLEKSFHNKCEWNQYWENIFIDNIETLQMYAHKYADGIIEEFDSLDELRKFDSSYIENTRSKVLKKIALDLQCRESDLNNVTPLKENGCVKGFDFQCLGKRYCYMYEDDRFGIKKEEYYER